MCVNAMECNTGANGIEVVGESPEEGAEGGGGEEEQEDDDEFDWEIPQVTPSHTPTFSRAHTHSFPGRCRRYPLIYTHLRSRSTHIHPAREKVTRSLLLHMHLHTCSRYAGALCVHMCTHMYLLCKNMMCPQLSENTVYTHTPFITRDSSEMTIGTQRHENKP